MVRRPPGGMFGDLWVFPGGIVEADDGPDDGDHGSFRQAAVRELQEETGIKMSADALQFISRWITPEDLPRRYDTRFFLGLVTDRPPIEPAADEVKEAAFVAPTTALAAHQAQHWQIVLPTLAHLRWLSRHSSGQAAVAAAAKIRHATVTPRLGPDGSVVEVDLPW